MQYIRDYYKVPARCGCRIVFEDDMYQANHDILADLMKRWRHGTIVGSDGQYLRVRFDGEDIVRNVHPTWNVRYL